MIVSYQVIVLREIFVSDLPEIKFIKNINLFRPQGSHGFRPCDEEHLDRGSANHPLDNINRRHHHRRSLWRVDDSVHVLA